MVLNKLRPLASRVLAPLVSALSRVNPDIITLISVVLAFAGGAAYAIGGVFLVASSVLIGLSGLLDAVDGEVARKTGKSSPRGDFLDHLGDRISDAAIIVGISFSAYATGYLCLVALSAVLLTSYLGTQAQAVGLGRLYGGLFGRADRMVLFTVLPLLQYAVAEVGGITPTDMGMVILIVLSVITFTQRLSRIWNSLKEDDEGKE